MPLRFALALVSLSAAALLAGCASHAEQSIEEHARAACVEEGVQPGPAMETCVQEAEETIRQAREYRPPPPPRPHQQQPQHHGS
jgi:hypothetical protein